MPSIFARRRLWRSSPVKLARQIGADDVRGQRRPDHASAEAEHVAVVVLDGLVGGVGVMGDDGADGRELARRHGHAGAGAAHQHRALGRRCARPRRPAAPCPGSRPGRWTRCRGRSPRARPPRRPRATIGFSGNPAWSNAHGDLHARLPGDGALQVATCRRRTPGRRSAPRRARPRAGRGARSGSWCSAPGPGTTWRKAASSAGSSSSSPARETPPPMTTSSGSNVLMALAMPMPIRSPSTRRHHRQASSPASAP